MSTPVESSNANAPGVRKGPGWWMTAAGALIVAAILVLLNWAAAKSSARIDWTENKVHTLTQGTKNIVGRIGTDTTMKFFYSPKDDLPPQYRGMVDQTMGWLARFQELNADYLKVEKYEVEPYTDNEDAAKAAGVEARGGRAFFGISVTCLDKTAVIDWVPDLLSTDGKEDDRIEYNLSKAISEVTTKNKKIVGVMSPLPVKGGGGHPFGGGGGQPWHFYQALKSQYEVKDLELTATTIGDDITVLVLVHPAGITEETQFALDQYLLKGGRVVAFLDPNSIAAASTKNQQMSMPGMPPQGGVETSSNLSRLLGAWGYSFDTGKIVADPKYTFGSNPRSGEPGFYTVLQMGRDAVDDKNDEVTKQIQNLFLIYSGGFAGKPAGGLTETVFLRTSADHSMVDMQYAPPNPGDPSSRNLMRELSTKLKPEGNTRLLAFRLNGKFNTAFPEGKPAPAPKKDDAPPGGTPTGFPGPRGGQGEKGAEGQPAAAPPPADAPATPPATPPANAPKNEPTPPTPPVSATTPPITIEPVPDPGKPGDPAKPADPLKPAEPPPANPLAPTPLPVTPAPAPAPATPPATPPAPAADAPLKEGTKDGVVYLVADSDILFSQVEPVMMSDDLAFALGIIDQAAGEADLINVRSRGSAVRPFSTLRDIEAEANRKIQGDIEKLQEKVNKINEDINKQKSLKERQRHFVEAIKRYQDDQRAVNVQINQKKKEARKEYDDIISSIKWNNLLWPPFLLGLAGLGVFIVHKLRTVAH